MNRIQNKSVVELVSSNIFTNSVRARTVEYITFCGVNRKQKDGIGEYLLAKVNADPSLTLRRIAERSGGEVTHSYLSKLISGAAGNPSIDKLQAIADGLGVPFEEVAAAAAGGRLDDAEAFDSEIRVAFKGFDELGDDDKRELLASVRILGGEIQRRRKRRAPAKGAKGKK